MMLVLVSGYVFSYDLSAVYNAALNHDPDVIDANLSLDKSEYDFNKSYSPFLPQVDLSYSYTPKNSTSSSFSLMPEKSITITANQKLYSYSDWSRYFGSEFSYKISLLQRKKSDHMHIIKIVKSYFAVIQAQLEYSLALSNRNANQKSYENTKMELTQGIVNNADFATAKSTFISSKSVVLEKKKLLLLSAYELKSYTGISFNKLSFIDNKKFKLKYPEKDLNYWLDLSRKNNTDYLISKLKTKVAESEKNAINGAFLPTVTAGIRSVKDTTDGFIDGPDANITASLTVSVPLFSGMKNVNSSLAAKIDYRKAQNNEQKELYSLNKEVESKYFAVLLEISNVKSKIEEVAAKKAMLDAVQADLYSGTSTIVDLLRDRIAYYQSLAKLSHSKHSYILATLSLYEVCGILNRDHLSQFNSMLSSKSTTLNLNFEPV